MEQHYVVINNYALSNMGISGIAVSGVGHSHAEAKAILAKASADERKYAEENNWTIYVDSDEEFDAGEEGLYAAEHAHFYIVEVEE